jgi:hypothetical protein
MTSQIVLSEVTVTFPPTVFSVRRINEAYIGLIVTTPDEQGHPRYQQMYPLDNEGALHLVESMKSCLPPMQYGEGR